jgi:hypothetical protein
MESRHVWVVEMKNDKERNNNLRDNKGRAACSGYNARLVKLTRRP